MATTRRMAPWARVGVVALIACLGLAVGPTARAGDVDQAQLGQAIEFRPAFGLNADANYVASVMVDNPTSEWGVALTDFEAADLNTRVRIASARGPLLEVVESAPEFAGFYTDQARGGILVVRLTKEDPGLLAAIRSLARAGAQVEIKTADYSWSQLEELQGVISGQLESLAKDRIVVSNLGTDPITNRVVVGLDPYDAASAKAISDRFGSMADVKAIPQAELTSCTTRGACDSPFRAGTYIHNVGASVSCTGGFMSRPVSGAVAGTWYMMTAGHCISLAGGSGVTWLSGTPPSSIALGAATPQWEYGNGANLDVGIIKVDNIAFPTNYAFSSFTTDTITGSISGSSQHVGDAVCRAGWGTWRYVGGSGWARGTIVSVDHDVTLAGPIVIHHQWTASFASHAGDSGGPIMNTSHKAMGIVSSSNSQTNYSPVDYAYTYLDFRPCYTSNLNPCG